jgi:hypothetical protein
MPKTRRPNDGQLLIESNLGACLCVRFMRIALLLISVMFSAFAAPITTTIVRCTPSCSGPLTQATATVNGLNISVSATYTGTGEDATVNASARITLEEDFILTLHSGTASGVGLYTPCLSASSGYGGGAFASGASAEASFDGFPNVDRCSSYNNGSGPRTPIAFDTPTLVHLRLHVSAYADNTAPRGSAGFAAAGFSGLLVSPGSTFTLVEAPSAVDSKMPEPVSAAMLGIGLASMLVVRRLRS